jgi:hypothetical protein
LVFNGKRAKTIASILQQSFFFLAGNHSLSLMKSSIDAYFQPAYETSQTALSFCMFELAVNQNIQEKLRKAINEVLLLHQNRLDYETLNEMVYLDQCVKGFLLEIVSS